MPLEIHPATPSDSPALAAVLLAAFSDDINFALFPRTQDVRDWWIATFTQTITDSTDNPPYVLCLKVIDTKNQGGDGEGAIVGFACWKLPGENIPRKDDDQFRYHYQYEHRGGEEGEGMTWPESCDQGVCDRFFEGMKEKRRKYMGDRLHYYLDILGVLPTYHGRGVASQLIEWGISRADYEGLEILVRSSPIAKGLYQKYGFQLLEDEEVVKGQVQSCLIREPRE